MSLNLLWRYASLQALQLDTVLHWPLLCSGDLVLLLFQIALLLRDQMKEKCADTFMGPPLQMVLSTAPVKFFCSFFLYIYSVYSPMLLLIFFFFFLALIA